MTVRVILVSSAVSTATAAAHFEAGHPLTPAGRASARAAAAALRATARLGPAAAGPARRPESGPGGAGLPGSGAAPSEHAPSEHAPSEHALSEHALPAPVLPGPVVRESALPDSALSGQAAPGSAVPVSVSDTVRCRETARELGLRPCPVGALDGWSVGTWRGRSLAEVAGEAPEAVTAWLSDPGFAPPGGESLADLCARVRGWLTEIGADGAGGGGSGGSGRVVAVVEPDVVRAALVAALDAPPGMFWRFDVRPLTATVLSGRSGRWNVRVGEPLTAGAEDPAGA